MVHDRVLGGDAVFVLVGLEGRLDDRVRVAVVHDHDVLIATAGTNGESASVIGVELFDGLYGDVDFAGRG